MNRLEITGGILAILSVVLLGVVAGYVRSESSMAFGLLLSLSLLMAMLLSLSLIPRVAPYLPRELLGRMRFFQITRRGTFFIILVALIGLATINTGNNLLILVLSFLLAALLVSGMASNIVLDGLKVSLNLPQSISAGQRAVLVLRLEDLKRIFPSFALSLRSQRSDQLMDHGTDFFSIEKQYPYIGASNSFTARMESDFHQRGVYPVSGFEIRTRFPFGFFTRGREIEATGKIVVFPHLVELDTLFSRYPFLRGPETRNQKGSGSGLYNIRDYQIGDDARFVHWKSSGKLSRLMVKELLQEQDYPLQIAFSNYLPAVSETAREKFEYAVSLVASLSNYYWEQSLRFSFYSADLEVVLDGHRRNFEALMEYLAWVQPGPEERIETTALTESTVLFVAAEPEQAGSWVTVNYLDL